MIADAVQAAPAALDDHEPRGVRARVRHYLRDLIYGANDGIITTFAIVAGVAGARLDGRIVLILGLAGLLADGFSMGASNYLSIRSDEAVRRAEGHGLLEPFPMRHGLATFMAFIVAGLVPLLSFLASAPEHRFAMAVGVTLGTLFAIGAARAAVTDVRWWRGGVEMLVVGAAAAAVAYGVGALVEGLL